MGVKTFFHELKSKVSASRFFRALVTDSHEVVPKCTEHIKSIETVEGHGVTPGCVMQTNFHDASHFKYVKHRIDEVDTENYVCKYTLIEGNVLGEKFEKICYELKFEPTEDGGCVIKQKSEYHTKGDVELNDEEIKAGKEQAAVLYKAAEEYLAANPHVCA
ncbi:pathogenesis-related protein STH-2-like [Sesamum indicum]|uniref:Pathogenesis-related protein STH-2-like n=1 Tax=Sesamum indicum TaxID=4182 RepID=A0A6I9STN9_SESIN|nr:pathogenesis-related protein STH-2-like [Sesamum indicum]